MEVEATLLLKQEADQIERAARRMESLLPMPAIDVHGATCIYTLADPVTGRLGKACREAIEKDVANGYLCWYHQSQLFQPERLEREKKGKVVTG